MTLRLLSWILELAIGYAIHWYVYVAHLFYVGSWLSINGEAIYSTKPWQYQNDTLNHNFWYVYVRYSLFFARSQHMHDASESFFHRYTYRPDTRVVYGTLTLTYQPQVVLGNVKTNSSSKISLVGYDGDVAWKPGANNSVEITMPPLPLDTELRWAWVFKFEAISPNMYT